MNGVIKSGLSLAIFTLVCIFLVLVTQNNTQEKIDQNINKVLEKRIGQLVSNYDNNIISSKTTRTIVLHKHKQVITIYTAKQGKTTTAYLIKHRYPRGYSGDILLLSAISPDNELLGMRVITHKETPGLGDGIEAQKSNWILQFGGQRLDNTNWNTKKQGGQFDQLSGATISSMALINAGQEILEMKATGVFSD